MKITKYTIVSILAILYLAAAPVQAGSVMQPLTDSVNSGIINAKIVADDKLSNTDIDATVVDGVAIFIGQVNSVAQRQDLIRIAQSVSGVHRIDLTKLQVVGTQK